MTNIIKASEIGEFYYCCVAWWLKKKGAKLQSPKQIEKKLKTAKPAEKIKLVKQLQVAKKIEQNLATGIKRHEKMGKGIVQIEKKQVQINYLKYIGYGILALIALFIIFSLI